MKAKTAKSILKQVKSHYDEISEQFSRTRRAAWAEFELYRELIVPKSRILDVGCGNGRFYFQGLADLDVNYTGLDLSKLLLSHAEKSRAALTAAEKRKVKFVNGTMMKLPFNASSFDTTFCIAAFHHIPGRDNRLKVLAEFRRVTKVDGLVVISVWNLFQPKYLPLIRASLWRFLKSFGRYDWNDTFFYWDKSKSLRYYHAFTPFEMRALLRDAGYTILHEFRASTKGVEVPFRQANNLIWICRV